jgi:DNA repair photolyase
MSRLGTNMTLNKQKGNMYPFITHTWNPIKGKCSHNCNYCYMKVYPQNELHLVEKELEDDLGKGNFIFVGSSTDMFAEDVPLEWINKVLAHMDKYDNTYLLQSKNPKRFNQLSISKNCILGTTIETNRNNNLSGGQSVRDRAKSMSTIENNQRMVTIEPIMDFDLNDLVFLIKAIQPEFVNIGADSKNHNLPEPSKEKIESLIKELMKFTKVNKKDNLKRLYI